MRACSSRFVLLPLLVLAGPGMAPAAEPGESVFDLSFEELQALEVVSAARVPQPIAQAPAVVAVITAEDLRGFGYRSVAEALEQVPGLYGVYDYLSTNVGVRGINAGSRAYSRILKVMIDGEPLAFASDASQFLGPELLPLGLVERIEVVRGPASALYGADAFLGVINIITRQPGQGGTLELGVAAESRQGFWGQGGELYGFGRAGAFAWSLGASAADWDRSGLDLPGSSPLRRDFPEEASRGDRARPANVLARLRHEAESASSELMLHAYRLDSDAEFLDFGALSHENRIALRQETLRLSHERRLAEDWELALSLSHGRGGPDDRERLSLDLAESFPERDFGFERNRYSAELRYRMGGRDLLSGGVDASEDREEGMRIFHVNRDDGRRVLVAGDGRGHVLRQEGAYLQLIHYPWERWGLTANLRLDRHNTHGEQRSYRLGLLGEPAQGHALKLLYGTSYKTPSFLQLHAHPLYPGEVLGNPGLEPESARSLELAWSWQAGEALALSVNAYKQSVRDKVELLPVGPNQRPQNRDRQEGWGLEGEARWTAGAHRLSGQLSWADTDDIEHLPFQGDLEAPAASYPRLVARLAWQYRAARWGDFAAAWRHVSPRRASKSNVRENFLEPYELDAYNVLRLSWNKSLGAHELGLSLVNALDEDYAEPGYNGVDIPGQDRVWHLQYRYRYP
ncbi:MAG: TonB-dependent receptor [Gammaproteobacteria bacterium]|nr:TonB-dependent receptor [Gammaproteobacteria bacterium]